MICTASARSHVHGNRRLAGGMYLFLFVVCVRQLNAIRTETVLHVKEFVNYFSQLIFRLFSMQLSLLYAVSL